MRKTKAEIALNSAKTSAKRYRQKANQALDLLDAAGRLGKWSPVTGLVAGEAVAFVEAQYEINTKIGGVEILASDGLTLGLQGLALLAGEGSPLQLMLLQGSGQTAAATSAIRGYRRRKGMFTA